MKVLFVTTRHGPQDDRIYHKEAVSLAKHLEVKMLAPDDNVKLDWSPGVSYKPMPRRRSALGKLWSLVDVIREILRERPDFCHLHDLDLALTIPFIRLFSKTKIIYDSHEVFTREHFIFNGKFKPGINRIIAGTIAFAEKKCVSFAHQLITAVDPNGQAYQGVRKPIRSIFNYPPLSLFQATQEEIEKELVRYRDRKPILYQGSISPTRGLFHMLDSIAMVKKKEPKVLLRLVGKCEGALRQAAEKRIAELDIVNQVELNGWQDQHEVGLSMRTSLIGLIPLQPSEKHHLALPNKLLEYWACGLPVIAARLRLTEQYMNECDGGLLYDSTKPEALAQAIVDLLADPDRRARMGENGRQAVQERWNWDKMEPLLFDVYASLGARCSGRRP